MFFVVAAPGLRSRSYFGGVGFSRDHRGQADFAIVAYGYDG
jgi:hypothetical protein